MAHRGKSLFSVFVEFFASVGEDFILAGGGHCTIILWGFGTFLAFPNFLGFLVLNRSATREVTCIYYVCKQ